MRKDCTYIIVNLLFCFVLRNGTDRLIESGRTFIPPRKQVFLSASTDYFRSKIASGNWSDVNSWESSADGTTWVASTLTPDHLAASITIKSGHTMTVSNAQTATKLLIETGAVLTFSAGSFTISDAAGDDVILQGTGSVFDIAGSSQPVLSGTATFRIGSGATLRLSGNNLLSNYHSSSYSYADAAVFEYSFTGAPSINGVNFFASQAAGATPVFRYNSSNSTSITGSGPTIINGKLEVVTGRSFNLNGFTGDFSIRNGMIGNGNFTLASTNTVQITGATSELGGSGTLNANLAVNTGANLLLSSNKLFTGSRNITVNGTFDLKEYSLSTASGTSTLNVGSTGLLKTSNQAGLTGGSLGSGFNLSFASGSTVEYNAEGNQAVSRTFTYRNLTLSGSGTKTAGTGGNFLVQGNMTISNNSVFALTGISGENLILTGSLLIESGGTFDNGGESNITNGGGSSITINGKFITKDQQGFAGSNTAIPSITPIINPGSIIEFGFAGNQTVQGNINYQNISFGGSGTKTPTSALDILGNVTISGTVVLDGSTSAIGGGTNITNNLTMTGTSRLIVGGSLSRPWFTGNYFLSSTSTIEFRNFNATAQTIRQNNGNNSNINYGNIEISGTNTNTPGTGITMQNGTSFTVKNGAAFKVINSNGLYGSSGAAILTTNNPAISLQSGSTIDYSASANQVVTSSLTYSHMTISGSGTKTALGAFTINGTFTRSGAAALAGSSPVYTGSTSLAYADNGNSRTYTAGVEWPVIDGPSSILLNLTGTGSPSVNLTGNRTIPATTTLSAGTLSVSTFTLTLGGAISRQNGTIEASTGSLILDGTTSQNIPAGTFVNNNISNLTISNTSAGGVTLSGTTNITNALSFGNVNNSLLNTGGNLTLKSTAAQTARVMDITNNGVNSGNQINGQVTVERHIPAHSSRKWRLVTSPVSGTHVNAAWQESSTWNGVSVNASTGYGTMITGQQQGTASTANGNGFDYWSAIANSAASIRTYQGATSSSNSSWIPVSKTTAANFDANEAYLIFVRGDRSISSGASTTATTLRAKGSLKTGNYQMQVLSTQTHTLLANPYASPLDFYEVYRNNTGIKNLFWIWDAQTGALGGYKLVSSTSAGNYEVVPSPFTPSGAGGNTSNRLIHSGGGFFVEPSVTGVGTTITIRENHKSAGSPGVSVFRGADLSSKRIYINLNAVTGENKTLLDGAMIKWNTLLEKEGEENISKPTNFSENISVVQNSTDLMVMTNKTVQAFDTLHFKVWNTTPKNYNLEMKAFHLEDLGLGAFLYDKYTGKAKPISLNGDITTADFLVNSDSASKDQHRFYIVFKPFPVLPVKFLFFRAVEKEATIKLEWKVANEDVVKMYVLEKSNDGRSFRQLTTSILKKVNDEFYQFDDQPERINYYRLKVIGVDGTSEYSSILKVQTNHHQKSIAIYPNPVQERRFSIQLTNMPGGKYIIKLFNVMGQKVMEENIPHPAFSSTHVLFINHKIPIGMYRAEVAGTKGLEKVVNLIIN